MTKKLLALVAVGFAAVWVSAATAQTAGPGQGGELPVTCQCTAKAVSCFFGTDMGCQISGCPDGCRCETAGCNLGFPTGSTCECI